MVIALICALFAVIDTTILYSCIIAASVSEREIEKNVSVTRRDKNESEMH